MATPGNGPRQNSILKGLHRPRAGCLRGGGLRRTRSVDRARSCGHAGIRFHEPRRSQVSLCISFSSGSAGWLECGRGSWIVGPLVEFVIEPTSAAIFVPASFTSGCVANDFLSTHRSRFLIVAVAKHWWKCSRFLLTRSLILIESHCSRACGASGYLKRTSRTMAGVRHPQWFGKAECVFEQPDVEVMGFDKQRSVRNRHVMRARGENPPWPPF